jgi:ubiquinone biosynthesis monooxygenase Coq7
MVHKRRAGDAGAEPLLRDNSPQEMWENERHHLNVLTRMAEQHRVRPTVLYPVWQGLAWGLGAGTALMGKEAAMACTEAVETVIGEHYDE